MLSDSQQQPQQQQPQLQQIQPQQLQPQLQQMPQAKEKIIHDSSIITASAIKKSTGKLKQGNKLFQESLYSKQLAIRS